MALEPWVETVAYCEQSLYAQSVLLSRMAEGSLRAAPICDDVRLLRAQDFDEKTRRRFRERGIIKAGFPCQDISVAGRGAGLGGKRSGLFSEIVRLAKELDPPFVFLENVPAIRTRGLRVVVRALTDLGYDCRWTCVSASSVGAPHLRKRWFLLAHSNRPRVRLERRGSSRSGRESRTFPSVNGKAQRVADAMFARLEGRGTERKLQGCLSTGGACRKSALPGGLEHEVAHSKILRREEEPALGRRRKERDEEERSRERRSHDGGPRGAAYPTSGRRTSGSAQRSGKDRTRGEPTRSRQEGTGTGSTYPSWWTIEPRVGRVANGVSRRVERITLLGNSVVPLQVRAAFKTLAGMK